MPAIHGKSDVTLNNCERPSRTSSWRLRPEVDPDRAAAVNRSMKSSDHLMLI
jgi:hypothetical protein